MPARATGKARGAIIVILRPRAPVRVANGRKDNGRIQGALTADTLNKEKIGGKGKQIDGTKAIRARLRAEGTAGAGIPVDGTQRTNEEAGLPPATDRNGAVQNGKVVKNPTEKMSVLSDEYVEILSMIRRA